MPFCEPARLGKTHTRLTAPEIDATSAPKHQF